MASRGVPRARHMGCAATYGGGLSWKSRSSRLDLLLKDVRLVLELFEAELARFDWRSMACGCGGTAGHLPGSLRSLASAATADEASTSDIEDHITGPSILQVPAPAVIPVSFAALQCGLSLPAHQAFLWLILLTAEPAGETADPQAWGRDLNDECRTAALEGRWYLYGQLLHQPDPVAATTAYRILRAVETTSRAEQLKALIGDRLLPPFRG